MTQPAWVAELIAFLDARDAEKVDKGSLVVSAMDHGAVGDGVIDDGPAILDAIESLPTKGDGRGGIVLLPRRFGFAAPIDVPDNVTLRGWGRAACMGQALKGFAGDYAFSIGGFHSRLEHIGLSLNGLVKDAVYTTTANEQSGVYSVLATGFTRHGFHGDGTGSALYPQNYDVIDAEFYIAASTTEAAAGVKLTASSPRLVDRVTVSSDGGASIPGAIGIDAADAGGFVDLGVIHTEHVGDAGIVGTSRLTLQALRHGPGPTTDVIRMVAGANQFVLQAVSATGEFTNLLNDVDRPGYNSRDDSLPFYAVSGGWVGGQVVLALRPDVASYFPMLRAGSFTTD